MAWRNRTRYASPDFWVGAGDQAVAVAAKAAVGVVGTNLLSITSVDWVGVLNVSAAAALVSLLVSVANARPR